MIHPQRPLFRFRNTPTNTTQPSAFFHNLSRQTPLMPQNRGIFPAHRRGFMRQNPHSQSSGLFRNFRTTTFPNSSLNKQGGVGNFLTRLFGGRRLAQNQTLNSGLQALNHTRAIPTAGGSVVQTAGKLGGINKFLNNTQQVLKAAQTLGPVVQQYGPLIKNLPAMWKLYRSLNDEDGSDIDNEEDLAETTEKEQQVVIEENDETTDNGENTSDTKQEKTVSAPDEEHNVAEVKNTVGASIPKLYI